ncbi:MAG: long-chain fatty acid--CoA ligase [Myxococcota bacterium]
MTLNLATIVRESAFRLPDKTALAIGDVTMTYGTIDLLARRFAGVLSELGVQPGQHIALMLPNVPQFTVAYYGGHYGANPIVPLNVLLMGPEVAYHLEDSDAVVLVAWEGFYEQARAGFDRVDTCKHLLVVKADPTDRTSPEGAHNMMALIGQATPVQELPNTMPDDTAVILYTSGTTGRPKGAELTHFNLFYNADYCVTRLLGAQENDVALATLPLFHSFGQTVVQNTMFRTGGTIVLLPRFEVKAALGLMQKHKVTFFAGVPTMYFALLNAPEADDFDLSSLRLCVSGGSAMPVEVMKNFDAKYNVNILEGYGLSETSPVACFNVLDKPKKAGSIGIPLQGVEFRLESDEGDVITESDTPGEVCIKGPNVMKGYYNKPAANTEAFKGGWFHTGDIATRDDEGYYFIVDRKKDMIIRGGYNVYPREIEEVLYAYPGVTEAAVIGIPHDSHGEEVKAIVALKSGAEATAEQVIAYCKEQLAAYKYPRIVEFMDELPKGPTGKILKRELR